MTNPSMKSTKVKEGTGQYIAIFVAWYHSMITAILKYVKFYYGNNYVAWHEQISFFQMSPVHPTVKDCKDSSYNLFYT